MIRWLNVCVRDGIVKRLRSPLNPYTANSEANRESITKSLYHNYHSIAAHKYQHYATPLKSGAFSTPIRLITFSSSFIPPTPFTHLLTTSTLRERTRKPEDTKRCQSNLLHYKKPYTREGFECLTRVSQKQEC